MTRIALQLCVVVLLVAGAVGPGVVAGNATPDPASFTQQDFDRTEFHIEAYANGSARWTFVFKRTLENETEQDAFREFADRFETERTDLYTNFVGRADTLTAEGTNVTGREMEATSFTSEATVDEGLSGRDDMQGVVRMSFLWTGFALTDGDRVIVGDVFEGGLYIGPNQALVFSPGPDLAFQNVAPAPNSQEDPDSLAGSDSVTWQGDRTFPDERPRVVFAPGEGTGGATGTPGGAEQPGGGGNFVPGNGNRSGLGLLPWLVVATVILVGGAVGWLYRVGAFDDGDDGVAASTPEDADAPQEAEPAISEEELMSDEDRVVSMLEERGGRMKQVNIVEETEWSKSKVSMLLSEMESEGTLSKLRVGRENIVSLSGHEPEATRSPFEDDDE